MQMRDIIRKKRDGEENTPQELAFIIDGLLKGQIPEYQLAAWLMAVYFNGLKPRELSDWTHLMWKSGSTLERFDRNDVWVDKHSVGGVGDKTSIILVPLVTAVCEKLYGKGTVKIPMISGRGLGHSGGTLDKLESVPGFSPHLSSSRALELLNQNGFFMAGQTEEICPADRMVYALRDVTETVDSIPLIVSSIMSKKLSENLDGLVIDLKCGEGAFMQEPKKARALGKKLLEVAKAQKISAVAVMTRMDEPLGYKVGNRLEMEECADFLSKKIQEPGLKQVVLELAAHMVYLGGRKKQGLRKCREACEAVLASDEPYEIFKKMFRYQGGDWGFFRDKDRSLMVLDWVSSKSGFVGKIPAKQIGLLLNELGGGRHRKEDIIDLHVGFEFQKKVGDAVKKGDCLVKVFYRKSAERKIIVSALERAITITTKKVPKKKWIMEIL
jgi:pyrimidine-nucleoside phosphorylase